MNSRLLNFETHEYMCKRINDTLLLPLYITRTISTDRHDPHNYLHFMVLKLHPNGRKFQKTFNKNKLQFLGLLFLNHFAVIKYLNLRQPYIDVIMNLFEEYELKKLNRFFCGIQYDVVAET